MDKNRKPYFDWMKKWVQCFLHDNEMGALVHPIWEIKTLKTRMIPIFFEDVAKKNLKHLPLAFKKCHVHIFEYFVGSNQLDFGCITPCYLKMNSILKDIYLFHFQKSKKNSFVLEFQSTYCCEKNNSTFL